MLAKFFFVKPHLINSPKTHSRLLLVIGKFAGVFCLLFIILDEEPTSGLT